MGSALERRSADCWAGFRAEVGRRRVNGAPRLRTGSPGARTKRAFTHIGPEEEEEEWPEGLAFRPSLLCCPVAQGTRRGSLPTGFCREVSELQEPPQGGTGRSSCFSLGPGTMVTTKPACSPCGPRGPVPSRPKLRACVADSWPLTRPASQCWGTPGGLLPASAAGPLRGS